MAYLGERHVSLKYNLGDVKGSFRSLFYALVFYALLFIR